MIKVESICKRGCLMDETYTKRLEREIWNMAEELDESNNYGLVLDFLNATCTQQKQNVSQMLTLYLLVSELQLVI